MGSVLKEGEPQTLTVQKLGRQDKRPCSRASDVSRAHASCPTIATPPEVKAFWSAHPFGLHYATNTHLEAPSRAFFDHIRPWMTPHRYPERIAWIERFACELRGRHLLEIGCGLGFETVEYLKRGVRVTATDLTEPAIQLARAHFALEGVEPVDTRIEDALDLSFPDETFDAVLADGVVHYTGDPARAIREIWRVLKPGGRAILFGFYRRPSWMRMLTRLARENVELPDEEAPVIDCLREKDILALFNGFNVDVVVREHFRAGPIGTPRSQFKMFLYERVFAPTYNRLPRIVAERFACKLSVAAIKRSKPS